MNPGLIIFCKLAKLEKTYYGAQTATIGPPMEAALKFLAEGIGKTGIQSGLYVEKTLK